MKNYINGAITLVGLALIAFVISSASSADFGPCRTEADYARLKSQINNKPSILKDWKPIDSSVVTGSNEWYDRKTDELGAQISEVKSMIDNYTQLGLCRRQIDQSLPAQAPINNLATSELELESAVPVDLTIENMSQQIDQVRRQILQQLNSGR